MPNVFVSQFFFGSDFSPGYPKCHVIVSAHTSFPNNLLFHKQHLIVPERGENQLSPTSLDPSVVEKVVELIINWKRGD